jgi:membrane protease subunit HflK
MAWDDGNNKDPWRPRGNQGPADLDAIVRDLQRKLAGLFGGRGKDREPGERGPGTKLGAGLLLFAAFVIAGLWALTGFYIVDEAERAVVLRFGKYVNIAQPGLRWHLPAPIEKVVNINTNEVVAWPYRGSMLTRDENIVIVDLEVQYVRTDPEKYVFSMVDPEETLQDITASAIREVVGKNDLAYILTEGRIDIADKALQLIQATLDNYGTGITVILLPMDEAQYPDAVQASVQDVVKAREDRERSIADANTYRRQRVPAAEGQAVRQVQDAEGYRARVIADAEGETLRFSQILAEYQNAPEVTRERLYVETMETVLSSATKIIVDTEGGNNVLYLPLDQLARRPPIVEGDPTGATSLPPRNVDNPGGDRSSAAQGIRR